MRRLTSILLLLALAISLAACAGESAPADQPSQGLSTAPVFMAGFGSANITPTESVPMAGYSDGRISEGLISYLYTQVVAVQDEEGELLLFIVADLSFIRKAFGNQTLEKLEKELDIPRDHIIFSGTHTHASVEIAKASMPSVMRYNETAAKQIVKAAKQAIDDLKPAEVYVGTAITENLNFVRRYWMDDDSLTTDNYAGTGTTVVRHESEADPELVMMKFVREGGKDILITNFQAHPHLETKSANISSQTVGGLRTVLERELDVHSLHWQGFAGNLNSRSRIEGETRTQDPKEYAELLGRYVIDAYDSMTKVQTGPIQVVSQEYEAIIDHSRAHMLFDAQKVVDHFNAGHTAEECLPLALELGFKSYYNAFRVVYNESAGYSETTDLVAWSFGDVAGVVSEYELFDTAGMQVKSGSPFAKTFVIGYAYPGAGSYIPTEEAFHNGGYERDSCRYVAGTSEEMVAGYLELLAQMHK